MPTTAKLSFEQHQQLAAEVVAILEHTDKLWKLMDKWACKWPPRTLTATLKTGRAANQLQQALESHLCRLDGNDLRSWELYFPSDREGSRVSYGGG